MLPVHTVYVRTLNSNNIPSSAPVSFRDWDEIARICFDNREADIGRFVRRHLSASSMREMLVSFALPPVDDSLKGRSNAILDQGEQAFQTAFKQAGVKPGHENALTWGYNAVALVVLPPPRDGGTTLDATFLDRLYTYARSTRSIAPPWHDGRVIMSRDTRPYTKAGAYEVLIDVPRPAFGRFEFSRLDPRGQFYCRSALLEEVGERRFHPEDTPTLDPERAVAWVVEAFLSGAAFARSMDADIESSILGFSFRWGNLLGRRFYNWNRMALYGPKEQVVRGDNEITVSVEFPLSVPPSALTQYAEQVTAPLFAAFDIRLPRGFVEHVASEGIDS